MSQLTEPVLSAREVAQGISEAWSAVKAHVVRDGSTLSDSFLTEWSEQAASLDNRLREVIVAVETQHPMADRIWQQLDQLSIDVLATGTTLLACVTEGDEKASNEAIRQFNCW